MSNRASQRFRARRMARYDHRTSTIFFSLSAALLLVACDPMTPPTKAELEADARKLLESKVVVKDPASNLCLIVLNGEFDRRPVFQTYLVRCKSEKHLLDPVAE